jgi:hypothetical protein
VVTREVSLKTKEEAVEIFNATVGKSVNEIVYYIDYFHD